MQKLQDICMYSVNLGRVHTITLQNGRNLCTKIGTTIKQLQKKCRYTINRLLEKKGTYRTHICNVKEITIPKGPNFSLL